jgi:DNA ligase (NAD+)
VRRRIEHFAAPTGMGIGGLGPALVDSLVNAEKVAGIADLYRLTRDDLLSAGKLSAAAADELLKQIDQSKRIGLDRLIYSLGIPGVGRKNAAVLAARFGGLTALAGARREDFIAGGHPLGTGVSEAVGEAVLAFFARPENRSLVVELAGLGLNPSRPLQESAAAPLAGKTFVLTGALPGMTRAEAAQRILAAGGRVVESVGRRTDFVVAGEGAGAKLDDAQRLGVAVLDESGLRRLLPE